MHLKDELFLIADTLSAAKVDYALCGGVAVAVHGYPRATRDIDLLIREEDLERTVPALGAVGYDLAAGLIPFDTGLPTARRVYRVSKADGHDLLTLDLILVSPFLEDVWASRERHEVQGRHVGVVSREGLAKMKRAAGRPQDLADLHALGMEGDRS